MGSPARAKLKKIKRGNKRYVYIADQLEKFVKVSDDLLVVDCAVGQGYGARILQDRGYKVLGFDIDEFALGVCATREIEVYYGDIQEIPCDDDSADIFVCSETLEHLTKEEMKNAALEIKRVCKNDAYICITVPKEKERCLENKLHQQYIKEKDIKKLLTGCKVVFTGTFKKTKDAHNLVMILKNNK